VWRQAGLLPGEGPGSGLVVAEAGLIGIPRSSPLHAFGSHFLPPPKQTASATQKACQPRSSGSHEFLQRPFRAIFLCVGTVITPLPIPPGVIHYPGPVR
jgi:hypothetical protein